MDTILDGVSFVRRALGFNTILRYQLIIFLRPIPSLVGNYFTINAIIYLCTVGFTVVEWMLAELWLTQINILN